MQAKACWWLLELCLSARNKFNVRVLRGHLRHERPSPENRNSNRIVSIINVSAYLSSRTPPKIALRKAACNPARAVRVCSRSNAPVLKDVEHRKAAMPFHVRVKHEVEAEYDAPLAFPSVHLSQRTFAFVPGAVPCVCC